MIESLPCRSVNTLPDTGASTISAPLALTLAANSRLAELQKKGVRTARVAPRETSVQKVYFSIREVPDALAAKLNDLRQSYAGTELKECPSEEKRAGK